MESLMANSLEPVWTSSPWPWPHSTRVLVLDSSFNPPTRAHAALVNATLDHFPSNFFGGVLLLLSTNNVDKQLTGASIEQRLHMMQLTANHLVTGNKAIHVAVATTPHARFIDKAEQLSPYYKDSCFIMGYDTIVRLFDPKYYTLSVYDSLAPFFKQAFVAYADRGTSASEGTAAGHGFDSRFSDRLVRVNLDSSFSNMSSTLARQKLQQDSTSLDDLLFPDVAAYAHMHHIYTQHQ